MDFDLPDHVLFNVNVAVVAMILRRRYGLEFERESGSRSTKSEEWEISEKLHTTLIECLETDDYILSFINWFLSGVRKTFDTKNNIPSKSVTTRSTSSFSLQYQQPQQILLFPDTCFQCGKPYSSISQDKWCNECESYIFESKFHLWTSGNVELDRFIRQTQQDATDSTGFLRWVPFSDFTDLNQIGKGGFSEVYSGKYTKDRLNGTLKQWVTNMEHQIILDYMKSHNGGENDYKNIEEVASLEDWDSILIEFTEKMRQIYKGRRTLKCRPREFSDGGSEAKVRRSNSFTKIKNLLRKRQSKKKDKKKSLLVSKLNERTQITQVPATASPRSKFVPKTVILKRLVNSQNLSSNFIKEMREQYLLLRKSSKVPRMYGLTQDPQSKDYYIVLQYANEFDLHKYLTQNCVTIDWWQRISILDGIVKGIYELHNANLIHHNLHTGNILVRQSTRRRDTYLKNTPSAKIWISDSGLWGPAGSSSGENNNNSINSNSNLNSSDSVGENNGNSNRNSVTPSISYSAINIRKGIYGVLPYIAPEVLQGKEYTKSSDIYSLGIIMWELSNSATLKSRQRHKQPFHDQPYDINLATKIVVDEKRPDIDERAVPECWLNLMKRCWASKPEDRPNIEEIMKITNEWNAERRKLKIGSGSSLTFLFNPDGSSNNENIVGQFTEAEKKRVERLNKGKQVERDQVEGDEVKKDEEKETKSNATETIDQDDDDDDIHPESSMKSRLIDFTVEILSSNVNDKNLEVIHESNSPQEYHGKEVRRVKKEKVDSGYQQRDDDDESLEQKENGIIIEKEKDSNKYLEDKTKLVKIDDNQIGIKQDNKDSPIKNGIEANSETGSKEITITKEKEP